ncbi:MAG: thiamine phosphate synthase [Sulfurovaceae bacterium]|nr:thiamine phosphate synthase [Sulfurovaceae bacterium]MDD5548655.1 thiamine phosphate synthase [Sulfurovaceae bacterium]
MIAYAISDKTNLDFNNLEASLNRIASRASMIVYRDKNNHNYKENSKLFLKTAKKYPFKKILLHTDIDLAYELKADGIHLQSSQIKDISYAKSKNLFIVVSTHTLKEALMAENLGANMITLSPIYDSPNKGEAIGLVKLKEVVSRVHIPVIALGGIITAQQIQECSEAGAVGFASIRYFT